MMISAVVAVALGVAPVQASHGPQVVHVDDRAVSQIGRYSQFVDRSGKTHIYGFDRLGRNYDLVMNGDGHVEGEVGIWHVSFDAADAG